MTPNEYQQAISLKLYDRIPKAVLAAIVVSHLTNHLGLEFNEIDNAIIDEWRILNLNGIVPQKP